MKSSFFYKSSLLVAVVALAVAVATIPAREANSANKKVSPIIDPDDPTSILYTDTSGNLAGLGDADNPVSEAWKAGQAWHPKALQAQGLPKDQYGLVDWAKLVREELIKPKHSLDPEEAEFPPLEVDVIIPAKGDFVKNVKYPHKIHTYWLNCDTCHATKGGAIFEMAAGENNMTMVGIAEGEWCGRCHGKVAFPLTDCARCHSVEKKRSRR